LDVGDASASAAPVKWAASRLNGALAARNVVCEIVGSAEAVHPSSFCVIAASAGSELAREFPPASRADMLPDSVRLASGRLYQSPATLVSASDVRGHVYGLLELAERVQFAANPYEALRVAEPVEEKSANEV